MSTRAKNNGKMDETRTIKSAKLLFLSVLVIFFLSQTVSAGWITWVGNALSMVLSKIVTIIVAPMALAIGSFMGFMVFLLQDPTVGRPIVTSPSYLNLAGLLMNTLIPVLYTMILYTAMKIILVSLSPGERAAAKTQLQKLIVAAIIAPISLHLYQLFLDMSFDITVQLLGGTNTGGTVITNPVIDQVVGHPVSFWKIFIRLFSPLSNDFKICWLVICAFILTLFAIGVVFMRYILVVILAVLLPIIVLFYLFDFTKAIGRKLLKQALAWAFTNVVMAVWIIVATATIYNTSAYFDSDSNIAMALGFFVLVIASPLTITGALESIGTVIASAGQVMGGAQGAVMTGAGQILKSGSPEAMLTTGMMVGAKTVGKIGGGVVKKGLAKAFKGIKLPGGGGGGGDGNPLLNAATGGGAGGGGDSGAGKTVGGAVGQVGGQVAKTGADLG
ncbi:MAG: type IV secretion system protein, partial [Candidatus Altiarchaeota archaeon]|nr:type IV secretion system protein [Candidatus Altiarchaeota archaeon]